MAQRCLLSAQFGLLFFEVGAGDSVCLPHASAQIALFPSQFALLASERALLPPQFALLPAERTLLASQLDDRSQRRRDRFDRVFVGDLVLDFVAHDDQAIRLVFWLF